MSVKETIHQWVDEMPDNSPALLEFYERVRLNRAIAEARADVAAGRVLTWDEADRRMEEKWARRDSTSS
jgi:hypothetical protein